MTHAIRIATRLLWLIGLACLGCSSASGPSGMPGAQGQFERGKTAYDRGRYMEAIELLDAFERQYPGSQFIDDALFYLGKAHQGNSEHRLARQAFERILTAFPRSSFGEEALYEVARSWFLSMRGPALDPEPAEEAVKALADYLQRHPNGKYVDEARAAMADVQDTLAEKAYLNGRTYLRLGRTQAARRYFLKSYEQWPQASVAGKAVDGVARAFEQEQAWESAAAYYERLVTLLEPDPGRYEDGRDLLARAREKLAALPR
jgi:outer membrane protein assembly factor BamD